MRQELRVLMIGGSGAVGRATVASLLKLPQLAQLTLLGRRVYEGFPEDTRLKQLVVDFDHLKIEPGHNVIVSSLGTTRSVVKDRSTYRKIEVDYPVSFAKLAQAAGVKHAVLVSSVGAKRSSLVRYLSQKGEVEDEWTRLDLDTLTILRPGLLGRGDSARAVEKLYAWLQKPIPVGVVGQAIAARISKVTAVENPHQPVILKNPEIYLEAGAGPS